MTEPKLRVRASNMGGSGYCIPTTINETTGKPLVVPGVTTVLNALPKDGTIQWSVDNTVAYMLANIDRILDLEDTVAFNRYRWYHKRKPDVDDPELSPYNAHAGALDDAANLGTFIHEYIEARVQGLIEPDPVKEEHFEMVEAFEGWYADHDVEALVVEGTVVNETVGYAGTLDGIWKIDGVPTLVDVKSSKKVYESHVAQLAALHHAEYAMIEDAAGVQYKGTGWSTGGIPHYEKIAVLQVRFDDYDSKGEFIPAHCDLHEIAPNKIEAGWSLFRAALGVKHAQLEWKQANK